MSERAERRRTYHRRVSSIEAGSTRIGWVGTGVMGGSMCGHLIAAGYATTVNSRTRARAEPLLDQGAAWAQTPAEVAAEADVTFTMVGYPADVREVILSEHGVLGTAKPGSVIIDMSTSEPSLAKEIFEAARERGVASIDAPVSGGDVGARNATLSIMVGGEPDDGRGGAPAARDPRRRRSSTRGPPAPGSTRRWSTRH